MASEHPYLSELTRRFRAARAYAGIEVKDAAGELEVSTSTLRRYERGDRPIPSTWVEWAISRWSVPEWLLPGDADLRERTGQELAEHARQVRPPSGVDDKGSRAPRRTGQQS